MRALVAILWATPVISQEPPKILQIYRDRLKPGSEAAFRAIEEDAARICAELKFPHPHLAMESLSGPKEVWWLNAFASEAERQRVTSEYERNPALVAALAAISKRREGLTTGVDVLTNYRADLSRGYSWQPAGARFFVVSVTRQDLHMEGSVFEAPDGNRFVVRPFRTRPQADLAAAASGPGTTVFAVRPYWGMPATEWIAADPDFWRTNPMANVK
jgi:hypothetical protein